MNSTPDHSRMPERSPTTGPSHPPSNPPGKSIETPPAINLRLTYPVTLRSIIRRTIVWILCFAFLSVILLYSSMRVTPLPEATFFDDGFRSVCAVLFFIGAAVVAARLVYEFIYYIVYYYGIELDHLVIAHGVVFKTRATYPIARMAGVYIQRTLWDLVFGTRNLEIFGSTGMGEIGTIEGLSAGDATKLQNYLLAMIRTTSPQADEEEAVLALESIENSTEEPTLLGASPQATVRNEPAVSNTTSDPDQPPLSEEAHPTKGVYLRERDIPKGARTTQNKPTRAQMQQGRSAKRSAYNTPQVINYGDSAAPDSSLSNEPTAQPDDGNHIVRSSTIR